MIRLSAFADEIAADLDEQITVLHSENIHFIDLRAAWGINVLDLTDQQISEVKQKLSANGIGVAAIASPIGKITLDSSFAEHLQRFERALTVARALDSEYIRIFSFYPPAHEIEALHYDPASHREEIIQRLREMTVRAHAVGITLLHENEKGIYGDTVARCVDLLASLNAPAFRSALDPANYLQCDQQPYPYAYEATLPWLDYVHVKDVSADGTMVVAGAGEACWPELLQRLRRDGYDGFMALEPHLSHAEQYAGFSGPERFRQASQALQKLLHALHWEYA